jgi:hypothetical protein
MRRWIICGALGLLLCSVAAAGWFFNVWLWPSIRYDRVHRAIYQTTPVARLELMASQVATVANTLGPTNALQFVRARGDIPSWLADVDPGWVMIYRDEVTVELCGGFDHYGFVFSRSENDSNLWTIVRRDESHREQVGTYRHIGAAINPVEPTSAPTGTRGSP